jgi:enoyl-CoA hydratase
MTEPVLKITNHDRVRLLTMNRPDRRNALSSDLKSAIARGLIDADFDRSVSVVAITGAGTAFCAGADLKDARAADEAGGSYRGPLAEEGRSLFEVMIDSKKPLIAILNGPAVGGGCELALSCDLRIASTTAHLALPEAKRGMGAHMASVVLPQIVPPGIAMEWLYTGRKIELAEAERWGLINRIAPPEQVMDVALKLAGEIAENAPLSLQRLKLTFRKAWGMPLHAGIRLHVGPDVYASEDRKEGARAYLEKRAPKWEGR